MHSEFQQWIVFNTYGNICMDRPLFSDSESVPLLIPRRLLRLDLTLEERVKCFLGVSSASPSSFSDSSLSLSSESSLSDVVLRCLSVSDGGLALLVHGFCRPDDSADDSLEESPLSLPSKDEQDRF